MCQTFNYAFFTLTNQNNGFNPTQSLELDEAEPAVFLETSTQTSFKGLASNLRIRLNLKMSFNRLMTYRFAVIETIFQSSNLLPNVHL